ncbi:hypothetical protein Trydic_g18645 [Trypoxylus dichotomus]
MVTKLEKEQAHILRFDVANGKCQRFENFSVTFALDERNQNSRWYYFSRHQNAMTKRKRPMDGDGDEVTEEDDSPSKLFDEIAMSQEDFEYILNMRKRIEEMKDRLNILESQVERMTSLAENVESANP